MTNYAGLHGSFQPITKSTLCVLAPCQPQGIMGSVDCVTNSAWISWLDAPGADSYTVSGVAVGRNDYRANCTTFTNMTCEMKDLACGVLYNFSVLAKNSECESQPSAPISLETGTSVRAVFSHFS